MIIEISDDELLELVSLGIKSGSYHEADISVALMADFAAPDLFVQLIGKTFVDSDGYLWVTPEFVVPVEFQQVVDYAFWQILAQAPDEALIACGIHRDQIQKVSFQAYGRIADPESTYQNYSQDIESDWKWGRQDGVFRLEIFPDLLWRFSSLFEINAEEAVFSTIPESIGRCSNLRKLVLRRGKFRMLPASIGNLSNLNHLSITHSEIQVLPESVSRLSGLTYLNLSCCWLTVLPRSVTRLTNLRHLNMFENRALREVHTDLYRLYNLEYLNLRGCSRLIPSELRTEYLNFVSVLNVRRRIAELAGIPFDVYQPVQQEPNRVLPPLPEPSGTSVVRKPISEPEQNRPATELICQLLESDEAANFMAGLRLLKSLYDMEVTEYVLNKIDVFRANQHQADEDDIPNLRQLGSIRDVNPQDWYNCYRAVIMFLVDPSSPVKRESDSWVTTLSELTLVVETEEDLGMISAFPGLRRLTLSSVNHLRHLDLKQINLPQGVSLRNITADTISLAGQKNKCLNLQFRSGVKVGKFSLNGLSQCTEIRSGGKTKIEQLVIRNCPQLARISFMAPESENPLTIIIRNCPCLTRCTFKVSAYDSIHITDCQKLDMLELSGRWCDSEKIVFECPAVRRLGIEDAGLSEVPELVYRFAALQALSFHQNSLSILPDSLAVLVNLQYIGLSGNRFESVPLVLAKFPNLKKIKMGWQTADTAGNNSLREGFEIFSMIARLEEVELFLPDEQLRKMAWHLRKPKARFIPCGLKWKFEK